VDATVRVQPLGGTWERLGSDRLRGITPEGIVASANDWGPDGLSFTLKAEEGARRPDLLPFTPIDLEIGPLCWSGFVWQRPNDANGYQVVARGWQYHGDDDLLDRAYVHTRLSDYVDARSLLTTVLGAANFLAAGQVSNDKGIVLAYPNGTPVLNGSQVGVVLDLGPDSTAIRVVVTASTSFNASPTFFVIGHDSPNYKADTLGSTRDDYVASQQINAAPWTAADQQKTFAATNARAHRYITILVNAQAGATFGADVYLRVHSIQAFRSASYESGNASTLKADQVIKDALAVAPLLNQSTAQIQAGTFSIPSYVTGGYQTFRQIAEAVNIVENYRLKIGGDDLRTPVYGPKPSAPIAEVGDWSGSDFSDSTVSGEPIYSRALVDASGPDGARLVSKRTQTGTLVDRRSFQRTARVDVSSAVTQAVADRIADLYLTEHKTAPFSGTLRVIGDGARSATGGTTIQPHEFLLYAGEKIRFANLLDPDTGGWGRDGRIAGVTYTHDTRSVEIAIDDQRKKFETILARYAALVGG